MSLMPAMLMAQAAGGTIKRPTKKVQPAPENKPANKPASKPVNKPAPKSGMSQADKERILQNLINNMVYVEGGTFTMGRGVQTVYDPMPTVTLSGFSIGKYEVTQEEWQAVMGSNPSHFKGAKRPVEQVSWTDCQEFIRKLNQLTGRRFRLPTEAEWEYAARGGNRSQDYQFAGSDSIDDVAWHTGNSDSKTHPVGQKRSNELGLYDMSGNVSVWCQDWYAEYGRDSQTNPKGPDSGSERVIRGGIWGGYAWTCHHGRRFYAKPTRRNSYTGLRLAL